MKHLLTLLILSLAPTLFCLAQQTDNLEGRPPLAIVQTGIGFQFGGETTKTFMVSIEKPYKTFWQLGFQGNLLFQQPDYGNYGFELQNGYELGFFAKYFLHGRLSGHKTGFFLGPELRLGARNVRFIDYFVFPQPIEPTYVHYKETNSKILLGWGGQWQFGHAVLEISAPFGIEFTKSDNEYVGSNLGTHFVILPKLLLGFAF